MQLSSAELEYASKKAVMRHDRFLAKIETGTPRGELATLGAFYPKGEENRLPRSVPTVRSEQRKWRMNRLKPIYRTEIGRQGTNCALSAALDRALPEKKQNFRDSLESVRQSGNLLFVGIYNLKILKD